MLVLRELTYKVLLAACVIHKFITSYKLSHWLNLQTRRAYWHCRLKRLGDETYFYPNITIHQPNCVSIGSRCVIADFTHIWGLGGVTIGDDVLIAAHVSITSLTHDLRASVFSTTLIQKPVVIEKNVWIGTGAIILPGVRISEGSIIGAGAVVAKDIPINSVAVGIPARIVNPAIVNND